MENHDPRRLVEAVRDHFSRHDRPLGFLFGAGTSCAVQIDAEGKRQPLIPAIERMTDLCREVVEGLGEKFARAWTAIAEESIALDGDAWIENMLSRIQWKREAMGADEALAGLSQEEMQEVETTVRSTIAQLAHPEEDKIPVTIPHDDFARWVSGMQRRLALEIFTTNYDLLFERSLERERLAIFDGFVGSR